MSLDVYLEFEGALAPNGQERIFIREDGCNKEISREEWNRRFPDREPVAVQMSSAQDAAEVYSANITHNLSTMASHAGIYEALWRPEEIGIDLARQLIEPLTAGLGVLLNDPERFKAFNPSNGWGSYDGLVGFVRNYLEACRQFPDATVYASR